MKKYVLAQLNVALMKEPIDSPLLADFVAFMVPVMLKSCAGAKSGLTRCGKHI